MNAWKLVGIAAFMGAVKCPWPDSVLNTFAAVVPAVFGVLVIGGVVIVLYGVLSRMGAR